MRVLTRHSRGKPLTGKVTGSVEATLPSGYSRHHERAGSSQMGQQHQTAGAGYRTLGIFVTFPRNFVTFPRNFVILTINKYLIIRKLQRYEINSKTFNTSKTFETFEVLSLITIKALAF